MKHCDHFHHFVVFLHVCHLRKIEQFQQIIDSNDQSVARLREQLRRLEPERERLSELVQQRQEPQ